jgi:hypothetical protein
MSASSISVTPGSGAIVGVDDATLPGAAGATSQQVIKILGGGATDAEGYVSGRTVDGETDEIAIFVEQRPDLIRHASTFATSATPDYTAGDSIGAGGTISSAAKATGGGLIINNISFVNDAAQNFELDVVFFRDSITAPTDNTAWAPSEADLLKICGGITVLDTDWRSYGARSVAALNDIDLVIPSLVATTLSYVVIAQGAFNFASTSDLTMIVSATRI